MSDEEQGIDEALAEAFDELEKRGAEEYEHEQPTETDSGNQSAAEGTGADGNDGEAEENQQENNGEEENGKQESELEPQYKLAPTSWTKEAKEAYQQLPDNLKREAHRREDNYLNGINQAQRQGQRFNPILEKHKQVLAATGASPEQALDEALNLSSRLRASNPQQKGQILRQLAEQVGADLTALGTEIPAEQKMLQQYLQPLYGEIAGLRQHFAASQPSEDSQNLQVIEEFRSETNESGHPKYPFFSVVEEMMIAAIPSITSKKENQGLSKKQLLEKAYEQAVWANPETRSLLQSEQAQQQEEARRKEAADKAAALEKANAVNLEKRGGHDGAATTQSMDETLSNKFDELVARA